MSTLSTPGSIRTDPPTTYEGLCRQLASLPIDRSDDTVRSSLEFVHALGSSAALPALLREVLADDRLLASIAQRSYQHTNHFDKIVLVDPGTQLGHRLTLHLWNPPYSDAEAEDEQIHDHRFSFWSHVVAGTLTSQNFVRDATGTPFGEYQYIPEKLNSVATVGNFYVNVGDSPLLATDRPRIEAGTSYDLTYDRIHRVILPHDDLTCTLVLRGPRQKNYASVFSNSVKYDPTENHMFSVAELADKLRIVLDHC
jgi:hypothetical protein